MLVYCRILLCTLGCLMSAVTAAECLPPATPILPDGAAASESEMIQAQETVAGFLGEARAYLQCLEQDEALSLAAETESAESKSQRDEAYQQMLETMKALNEQLLVQLQEFRNVDQ